MTLKGALQRLEQPYHYARREHVYLLRCEGLTLKQVGERLGVGPERVRQMQLSFEEELRTSLIRTRARFTCNELRFRATRDPQPDQPKKFCWDKSPPLPRRPHVR
jgi:hypothetical protein